MANKVKKNKGHMLREEILQNQLVGLLPRMRRFAMRLSKDLDRADDLVQAACERALSRLDQIREENRLDSWLYRIIYTQWIDRVRRQKTRSEKLIVLSKDSEFKSGHTDSDSYLNAKLDVHRALESLSEEHQVAVMLVSVEGYSYAEAAEVLNVPVGTVASRVARARSMMGSRLKIEKGKMLRFRKMEANDDSAVR